MNTVRWTAIGTEQAFRRWPVCTEREYRALGGYIGSEQAFRRWPVCIERGYRAMDSYRNGTSL